MNRFKYLAIVAAIVGICFAASPSTTQAQISISIGPAPVCPYGYYDYSPYNCAPYGYYGPEWFTGGVFIGAGPWFHGPRNFRGHVNNHFDPRHGYHGPFPHRGARPDRGRPAGHIAHFKGNETRDSRNYGHHENYEHHENGRNNGHDNGHHNDHK